MREKLIVAFSAVLCCGLFVPAFAQVEETVVEEKVTIVTDSTAAPAAAKNAKAGIYKIKSGSKAAKARKFDKRHMRPANCCDSVACDTAVQCPPNPIRGKVMRDNGLRGKKLRHGHHNGPAFCDSIACDSTVCDSVVCNPAKCDGRRGGLKATKGPRQHSKGHRHHSR